eukprot:COSAG01_NODE_1235_length_11106_cov_3.058962_7_plen_118_part_00
MPQEDLYQAVFCGFIVHLTEEEKRLLTRQGEVLEVTQVGAKYAASAEKKKSSGGGGAGDGEGAQLLSKPSSFAAQGWARKLGRHARGERPCSSFTHFTRETASPTSPTSPTSPASPP